LTQFSPIEFLEGLSVSDVLPFLALHKALPKVSALATHINNNGGSYDPMTDSVAHLVSQLEGLTGGSAPFMVRITGKGGNSAVQIPNAIRNMAGIPASDSYTIGDATQATVTFASTAPVINIVVPAGHTKRINLIMMLGCNLNQHLGVSISAAGSSTRNAHLSTYHAQNLDDGRVTVLRFTFPGGTSDELNISLSNMTFNSGTILDYSIVLSEVPDELQPFDDFTQLPMSTALPGQVLGSLADGTFTLA